MKRRPVEPRRIPTNFWYSGSKRSVAGSQENKVILAEYSVLLRENGKSHRHNPTVPSVRSLVVVLARQC
jgi:hypothetical protein